MGLWLPLALSDIAALVVALIRLWAVDKDAVKIPTRSETLASWCLPMLSRALACAEEERAARELFESVERLKRKQEGGK